MLWIIQPAEPPCKFTTANDTNFCTSCLLQSGTSQQQHQQHSLDVNTGLKQIFCFSLLICVLLNFSLMVSLKSWTAFTNVAWSGLSSKFYIKQYSGIHLPILLKLLIYTKTVVDHSQVMTRQFCLLVNKMFSGCLVGCKIELQVKLLKSTYTLFYLMIWLFELYGC